MHPQATHLSRVIAGRLVLVQCVLFSMQPQIGYTMEGTVSM